MTTGKSPTLNRLKTAAEQAAARAAAAKRRVREAKAQLKVARKLFKAEKKASKQARRKLAAVARTERPPKAPRATKAGAPKAGTPKAGTPKAVAPKRSSKAAAKKPAARRAKPRRPPAPETMRSAAEVAKSVIERLHAPPPTLPPEPLIPASDTPRPD